MSAPGCSAIRMGDIFARARRILAAAMARWSAGGGMNGVAWQQDYLLRMIEDLNLFMTRVILF